MMRFSHCLETIILFGIPIVLLLDKMCKQTEAVAMDGDCDKILSVNSHKKFLSQIMLWYYVIYYFGNFVVRIFFLK